MAYSYGIPDGTYAGKPTTASCYEKDGRLMLDVRFMVKDPATGEWYKNERGYDWEVLKRNWLTSAQGAFNEKTVAGLREWAKGWDPKSLDDFWWFQSADANGVPFGNLAAVGEVELDFTTDANGNQSIFVHDPNRPRAAGRKAYVPDGASADKSALAAKWGTRAKALFAATPKKMATPAASAPKDAPAGVPPQGGIGAPVRATAAVATPPGPLPRRKATGRSRGRSSHRRRTARSTTSARSWASRIRARSTTRGGSRSSTRRRRGRTPTSSARLTCRGSSRPCTTRWRCRSKRKTPPPGVGGRAGASKRTRKAKAE